MADGEGMQPYPEKAGDFNAFLPQVLKSEVQEVQEGLSDLLIAMSPSCEPAEPAKLATRESVSGIRRLAGQSIIKIIDVELVAAGTLVQVQRAIARRIYGGIRDPEDVI